MSQYGNVSFAFIVCSFPTAAMLLASILFTNLQLSNNIEAGVQYLAAGLILAAVACELIPLMMEGKKENSFIGISVGFVIGYAVINGMEVVIDYITQKAEKMFGIDKPIYSTVYSPMSDVELANVSNVDDTYNHVFSQVKPIDGIDLDPEQLDSMAKSINDTSFEEQAMLNAEKAISFPSHREHIRSHLDEVVLLIKEMEAKSYKLLLQEMSVTDSECIAEEIDESIHQLQYKVDHCKRLIQGSEASNDDGNSTTLKNTWLTDDKKIAMNKRLLVLECTANHLIEHLGVSHINKQILQEMIVHLADMDNQINLFHDNVDEVVTKWQRLPEIEIGSKIPMSLIVPVTIDCFVDGFLIGVSVTLSPKAGYVLTLANCMEMSFLGMAYSSRIIKCTGSDYMVRQFSIMGPPCLMLIASGFGACLAQAAVAVPAVYISFVSFGVVALIGLACNELLIEAHQSQGEDGKWFVKILFFVGFYLVLMVDNAM